MKSPLAAATVGQLHSAEKGVNRIGRNFMGSGTSTCDHTVGTDYERSVHVTWYRDLCRRADVCGFSMD